MHDGVESMAVEVDSRLILLKDPYSLLRRLQTEDPVHWDDGLQMWLLTRYEDVLTAMRDPRFAVVTVDEEGIPEEARADFPTFVWLMRMALEHMNPPDHTSLRRLVSAGFSPRMIESFRPRVQTLVESVLDRLEGDEAVDILNDVAYPIVASVTPAFIGVPADELETARGTFERYFSYFSRDLRSPAVRHEAERAAIELIEYFRSVLERRRRDRQRDLMSVLLSASERGGALTDDQILALCIQLLVAGWQATPNFLANGVAVLLEHPDQLARLRQDPSLIPTAVEELLRYDPVIRLVTRVTHDDVEIGGTRIARGQLVALILAASGRDPQRFPDPDRLDVGRSVTQHLALGYGMHFCLGAALARVVAASTFGTLLHRWTTEQLAAAVERAPRHFSFPRPVTWG